MKKKSNHEFPFEDKVKTVLSFSVKHFKELHNRGPNEIFKEK